jgi:pyruvate dehydrogenase E2 component (dihydrolipoamide acetyltransferase)
VEIKLPRLGEGTDSGTVVSVLVKEGDRINKDQNILELENEKAVAAIPSTSSGVVTKVYIRPGDKIQVGQNLISLSENGAATQPSAAPTPKVEATKTEATPTQSISSQESKPLPAGLEPAASPSLRKLARELGIDLTQVQGSERGGRIVIQDVKAYVQKLQEAFRQKTPAQPPSSVPQKITGERIDFSKWGPIHKTPVTSLRRTIANKMVENWTTIPHVTQFDEADVTALIDLRKKHISKYEKKGVRLTLTPFILKAVISALKKQPIFNSSLDEETNEIILKDYFHLGIAVDTEAGLIVPVLRDADKKDLLTLSKDLEDISKRTRERKISGEELRGGTFTISNQGGIGGAHFTPIVNKPQVAILGLGRGAVKPKVVGKKIAPRTLLPVCLSYDHRVIDGALAARFITDLVQALENFPEKDVLLANGNQKSKKSR